MVFKLVTITVAVVLACVLASDAKEATESAPDAVRTYGSGKRECYRKPYDYYGSKKHDDKKYQYCCKFYYPCWRYGKKTYDKCYYEKCFDYDYDHAYRTGESSEAAMTAENLAPEDVEVANSVRSGGYGDQYNDYDDGKKCYRKYDHDYENKHGYKRYQYCCRHYYGCWYNGKWTHHHCYYYKCSDYKYEKYSQDHEQSTDDRQVVERAATEDSEAANSVRSSDYGHDYDGKDGKKKHCYRKYDEGYSKNHHKKRYQYCCYYYYRCWYNGKWTFDHCYYEKCYDKYYY